MGRLTPAMIEQLAGAGYQKQHVDHCNNLFWFQIRARLHTLLMTTGEMHKHSIVKYLRSGPASIGEKIQPRSDIIFLEE